MSMLENRGLLSQERRSMASFLFDAEVGRAGAGGRWWEVEVVGRPVVRLEPVGRQSPPREP